MKVFCPLHKRGFFTPRQSPIKCENRGHVLGALDFHGEARAPVEIQWQYCCNCEHFCPIDFDGDGLESCPACTRQTSKFYLCDRCFTVTFESNPPLQTKNFTLTSEGGPHPSCPGCLQETSADLHEHDCDELGACFITALSSCPICLERLDVSPLFPSSVAHYLKRTKATNKLNVTFDYDTELFIAVDDGELVLISNSLDGTKPIVLPRSARFASKRDFYELYQDYYHSAKLNPGEVHIIEPASVEPVQDGWKLKSTGILEVVDDPKTKASANTTLSQRETSIREKPGPSIEMVKEESAAAPCTDCGSLVETRYAFCWNCGNAVMPDANASKRTTETTVPSLRIAMEDEEVIVQHDVRHAQPSIFSWALPKQPGRTASATVSVLKLIAVAVVGLLLVPLGLFMVTRSSSQQSLRTDAQRATSNLPSDRSTAPIVEVTANATAEQSTAQVIPVARTEEDELQTLRQKRIGAAASDRLTILQAFARTEKQYPNDYRFPYERAKLAINGPDTTSHEDAFRALSLAAEKAIKTDKAQEMLKGLEADKGGDFHKLSHGHREWSQVLEALKSKDTTLLTTNPGF